MKKAIIELVIAVGTIMLVPQLSMAGTAMFNQDMQGSKMAIEKECMPPAIFVGVAFADEGGKDSMDAATAICYSDQQGEFLIPNSDFGDRAKVYARCDRHIETVYGIATKDRVDSDETDCVTVICRNKKTGDQRIVDVQDCAGGRAWVQFTNKNASGISCNDRQGSDATDGCTLIYRDK